MYVPVYDHSLFLYISILNQRSIDLALPVRRLRLPRVESSAYSLGASVLSLLKPNASCRHDVGLSLQSSHTVQTNADRPAILNVVKRRVTR